MHVNDAATRLVAGGSNRNLKRIFTVLAVGWSIALASFAQRATAPLPNAPRPAAVLSTPSEDAHFSGVAASLWASNAANSTTEQTAATEQDASQSGNMSLYTVVDLALRNSSSVRMAEAKQRRALAVWSQTRDIYIPTFSVGSGLGYSYGFPLGNPTLFNVQSNFMLFSFSQRDYIRSARAAAKAATLSLKDARRQVILDASVNYIELNKTLDEIHLLQQAASDADKLVAVVRDRLNAGLESEMDLTRARLTRAQIQLQLIRLQDHADELRKHLAGLTGLDADAIIPAATSVPALPDLDFQGLLASGNEPLSVQSAFASADAHMYIAWGDEKQNHRPTVMGAFLYSRFASFNGYDQYYKHFTPNNVGIGINATWPIFDRTLNDKAKESAAIAAHDRAQAELAKIQSDESNFALWHSLRELEAEEQVDDLQRQLAQDTLNSTVTQMNQGSPNGKPIPPQQAEQDRVDAQTSFVTLEDAQFAVTRLKLDLLSAVGDLEDWAKQSAQPSIVKPSPSTH